jgi:aspartate kinase
MIVIKFGGTSVGDAAHMKQAIEIVSEVRDRDPVVVVSALSGITNQLVEATALAAASKLDEVNRTVEAIRERHEQIAYELVGQKSDYLDSFRAQLGRHTDEILAILKGICLVGEVTPRAKDKIVAIGEKLSSVLFSYTMRLKTLVGIPVDAEEVIVTNERFGEADPMMDLTREAARRVLLPEIERRHIPVMGGFIGRSEGGATTTLGRGGSDYSAAIVGAALGAAEIQIWTDVDGMMTTDPRVIPSARIIEKISYVEAAELAYFGAKVLHPKTIAPAVAEQIPIRVLNTHNPSSRGTLVTEEGDADVRGPRAIALKRGISVVEATSSSMLGAHGFLARFFEVFARLEIPVDLITTSEVSVSVTIDEDDRLERLERELSSFASVEVDRGQAIVALVGRNLARDSSMVAAAVASLGGISPSMISLGRSGLNLSFVIPGEAADGTLERMHRAMFESHVMETA